MGCNSVDLLGKMGGCFGVRTEGTHGAHSEPVLSCCTVHLVTETLDVIRSIDNEYCVLAHFSLHSSEQCPPGRFL
jgi:hypothetical protein